MEKDKLNAKKIIRYLLFYGALIFVLSLTSYFFDLLFYAIDYGSVTVYRYSPFQYIPYFMIVGYMIFPLSFIYNYVINHFLRHTFARIAAGCLTMIILGFLFGRNGTFGYYIGEYRQIKNLLALGCAGVFIELVRIWVVKIRMKKKFASVENLSTYE